MRTIIIGDIHGCYDEWVKLLHKIEFDPAFDELILLGDLMDRGKDSYQVYQKAKELKKMMKKKMTILKGSHEKMLLDSSSKIWNQLIWNLSGKRSTILSFKRHNKKMESSKKWFEENCVPYYEGKSYQCCHASIINEDIKENDEYVLMMDHHLTKKNRYNGKLTITGHIHLHDPTYFDGSKGKGQILSYHESKPLPQKGVLCIDTSCAEGNRLTAMIIENNQYYLEYVKKIHRFNLYQLFHDK